MYFKFVIPLLLLTVTNCEEPNLSQIPEQIPFMSGSRFGEKYDEALEAIFSIAIRLEALLSESGSKTSKNFIVSPLGMAVAVGELILGARGKLQDELYELLTIENTQHYNNTVRHHKNEEYMKYQSLHEQLGDLVQNLGSVGDSFTLKTTSALFIQQNLTISEYYQKYVKKYYGTQIKQVDFLTDFQNTQKYIDQWTYNNTNGLIKTILPGGISPQTVGILANAVYLKADWEIPFSSEINRILSFKVDENTTKNTTFMMGEFENYKYVENKRLNCRMVVIPYTNNDLSMYIILPNQNENKEYNINSFVSTLRTKDIMELISTARERKVFMLLPKMSLSNTVKVLGPLRKYHSFKNHVELQTKLKNLPGDKIDVLDERVQFFKNVSRMLTEDENGIQKAADTVCASLLPDKSKESLSERSPSLSLDLSGISTSPEFYLGELVQQTTLTVHEKGTEAAAVSASAIDYILDSVTFRVDRPFLFFIRHEQSEANLFWGTIQDPTEN